MARLYKNKYNEKIVEILTHITRRDAMHCVSTEKK